MMVSVSVCIVLRSNILVAGSQTKNLFSNERCAFHRIVHIWVPRAIHLLLDQTLKTNTEIRRNKNWLSCIRDLGVNAIRRSVADNEELISPRKIGNIIERWENGIGQNVNHSYENIPNVLGLMMGQAITHDAGALVKKKMTGNYACDSARSALTEQWAYVYIPHK